MRSAFLIVALAAGCEPGPVTFEPNTTIGDDDDDTGTFGESLGMVCDAIDELGTCTRYTGGAWDLDFAKQNCAAGTFYTVGVCPRATIGECWFAIGQPLEQIISYYEGVWYDAAEEEALSNECGFEEGAWLSTSNTGT